MKTTELQKLITQTDARIANQDARYSDVYEIEKIIDADDAQLVLFNDGDDISSACVVYSDNTAFFLCDWQGARPESLDEIEDYDWVSADGKAAIMLNGLPRVL